MSDLVARLRLEATGGAQSAAEIRQVEGALARVPAAAAAAGASVDRMGAQVASSSQSFVGQYNSSVGRMDAVNVRAAASTREVTLAGLGLSRQLADIATTGFAGMSPLMIIMQQGPQIADQLALMKMQGLGLSQVMRQLAASTWAAIAPLAPFIATGVALAAVIGGTAALAARQLEKDNKNLVASMGLTEKQMKRLKDQGVDTGVTIGDVFRGTFNFLAKAAAPILAPIAKFFSDLFDRITRGLVATTKAIVGGFMGAFEAVKATWRNLPAAMSDLAVSAANATLSAIEAMINKAGALINVLIDKANAAARQVGLQGQIGRVGEVSIGQIRNDNAGAAAKLSTDNKAAFAKGYAAGGEAVDGFFKAWGDEILNARKARVRKAAGDADKPAGRNPATPRDQTDERTAQVAGQIAQAMQEELRARLGLAKEASERAEIEKRLVAAALSEQKAQLAKQIAAIADDKGLSAARKSQLTAELERVKAINETTAALQVQAIEEQRRATERRSAHEIDITSREAQLDLLGSQRDLNRSATGRNRVELEILKAQHQIERLKLEEIVASSQSTKAEKEIARSRLRVLEQIQANEVELAGRGTTLADTLNEMIDEGRGFADAIGSRDWGRAFARFSQMLSALSEAGGGGGFLGQLASSISNAVPAVAALASLSRIINPQIAKVLGMDAKQQRNAGTFGLLGALVGGKASNHGAGIGLTPDGLGPITGSRRNDETVGAVTSAGNTVLDGQALIRQLGATLTATVTGLVIGTRDPSQIYLSNGQTLTAAVGDTAAAAETALKAVLAGATFADKAQESLVQSMLAAGKGFDSITEALGAYAQAQGIPRAIEDAILQLSDPKAWAVEELRRNQEATRKELKAAADAGYLTAVQFESASARLAVLEGLQLDDVLAQFAEAVTDTTEELEAQAGKLRGSIVDRILELTDPAAFKVKRINDDIDARITEAQPLIAAGLLGEEFLSLAEQLRTLELGQLVDEVDATTKAFQDARPKLLSWIDQIRAGPAGELSPKAAREEAMRQFQRELAKAQAGDANALGNITSYADRLLETDRTATGSASERLALRNQVLGQIEGLAGRGATLTPAQAIQQLQAPLGQIAAASAAELATLTSAGKSVVIANLPSMQAMYGELVTTQTDRLVAANDRNAAEIVASVKALAESQAAALSQLAASVEGAVGAALEVAAGQAAEVAAGLQAIADEARLTDARQRAAG